jgi:transcriptional antiterminator RfaH
MMRTSPHDDRDAWLVVQTKPRQERVAVSHLVQREVVPYCPLFLEPVWHLRAPRGPVPLFAGYIFVRCDCGRQLNAVRYCPGVLRPVSFDRRPATVDGAFIASLRDLEGDRGFIIPEDVVRPMSKGCRVRVMGGPLKGLEGMFNGYVKGGQRAQVLLGLLRAQRLVEVDVASLSVVA